MVNYLLKNHREEKVLVICRHANTAIQLEQALREKEAIRAAVFHEKLSIVERDRAAAYFAQQEDGAQVLLSSSIGSEGRNFQFASHLVLFNLPDDPDLLEQCIGRLIVLVKPVIFKFMCLALLTPPKWYLRVGIMRA